TISARPGGMRVRIRSNAPRAPASNQGKGGAKQAVGALRGPAALHDIDLLGASGPLPTNSCAARISDNGANRRDRSRRMAASQSEVAGLREGSALFATQVAYAAARGVRSAVDQPSRSCD